MADGRRTADGLEKPENIAIRPLVKEMYEKYSPEIPVMVAHGKKMMRGIDSTMFSIKTLADEVRGKVAGVNVDYRLEAMQRSVSHIEREVCETLQQHKAAMKWIYTAFVCAVIAILISLVIAFIQWIAGKVAPIP